MESQTAPSKCSSPFLISSKSFSSELAKKGGSPQNLQQRQSFCLDFLKIEIRLLKIKFPQDLEVVVLHI